MLMYLNQSAVVKIGKVVFLDVNSIEITQSITDLSQTAKLVLPRNYKELDGKPMLMHIKIGDKVTIELGYRETGLYMEYIGYVREISSDIPIEITCDEMYPLRQNSFIKSYKTGTLKQILKDVTTGTFIKKIQCPNANTGKFQIDNASTYSVLEKIKEEFGLYARVFGDTLVMGWAWDWNPEQTKKHTYNYQDGSVKSTDLKYKTKEGFNVRVKVKIRDKKSEEKYVEVGSKEKDAAVTTIEYAASNAVEAKKIAEARFKKSVYDGYTGNITGFGVLRTCCGDSLEIIDQRNTERQGVYLIEKVTITYNNGGISRKNELAYRI